MARALGRELSQNWEAGRMLRWLPQGLGRLPASHFFSRLFPQAKSVSAPRNGCFDLTINLSAEDLDVLRELSAGPRRIRVPDTATQARRNHSLSRLVQAGCLLASLNPSGHAQAFAITEVGRATLAAADDPPKSTSATAQLQRRPDDESAGPQA
jgi:hypothetical protein